MSYNWAKDPGTTVTVTSGYSGQTTCTAQSTGGSSASTVDEDTGTHFYQTASYSPGALGYTSVSWARVNITFFAPKPLTEIRAIFRGEGNTSVPRCFLVQYYSGGAWHALSATDTSSYSSPNVYGEAYTINTTYNQGYTGLNLSGVTQVELFLSATTGGAATSTARIYELYTYGPPPLIAYAFMI